MSHIRVLDLTRVLAGPWCGQNLADLGAEVTKVERPGKGDDSRAFGPPWIKDAAGNDTAEAAYFVCANRGKQSVTLDLSKPEAQQIVRRLAAQSDVLLENYKVGDLARYGLGYDDLSKENPGLIYCSITGFGQTGPYKDRPGYDFMAQGMGGLMSVTGERDDLPGGGPQRVGVPIVDIMTGMYASIAVCAAIAHRAVSGRGQYIDMALLDTQVAFLSNQGMNYLATGEAPARLGNTHPNIVPYQTFRTSDGAIILACGNDNLFRKFCEVAGCGELAIDARFATNGKRVENRAALTETLDAVFARRSTKDWVAALEGAGVPNGPINDLKQVFEEPQVIARGMRIDVPHPTAGTVPMVASPMRFSATPIAYEVPPPTLGQHTAEVLAKRLSMSAEEIERLKRDGIV
ncbi:MAG: CoA transferase [Rhodocyclaceae bacterium]|nr:CoA transferase [Rhodocyclaceae bacterium]MCA3091700.1 CoA transferase [Rhodocyclaceae bacterium]MCA3093406.1 CoA transferase [Rhodocyclaceae bacterium]MCA3096223.1 CoA transferase [Rhodocyclaceae bacterium]MCA3101330.1 CoA transferase [Rhodocyclaceae bacterium]